MTVGSYKEYSLSKYSEMDINFLINRKLLIHKQLGAPSRTYVVYSDLHGSYDKYLFWIKNGLGYYQIAISEILGAYYSEEIEKCYERLFLLVNRTKINAIDKYITGEKDSFKNEHYFYEPVTNKFITTLNHLEKLGLTKERIIKDLLIVLRSITRGDEHRIIKKIPSLFLENIIKLYFKKDKESYESLIKGIVDNQKVYQIMSSIIVKLILANMFDKHINLGDTFDRGNGPDKLIEFYKIYFSTEQTGQRLHYIWGNHDILWMGATIGNPILCATALRISIRYNNIDFLLRYGFNLNKLKDFAINCYKDCPTGKYIKCSNFNYWHEDIAVKMTKALLIIETKLTVSLLKEVSKTSVDFDYHKALNHYNQLLEILPTNITEDQSNSNELSNEYPLFSDLFFPTIKSNMPEMLTPEEQDVINDLVLQFTTLPKLKDDMTWMFQHGEMYRVVDNTIFFHAAVPATKEMTLSEINGMKGKVLFDFIQRDLKRIGDKTIVDQKISLEDSMLFWYLWCGEQSPFFCKNKMATLEKAIFREKEAIKNPLTTWEEIANPYYSHTHNEMFLNQLLIEFHAQKICMGHTQIKSIQQGILGDNHRAYIIDGGVAEAYGDRGAVLINTPDFTYVTFHPSLEQLKIAENEDRLPDLSIMPIETQTNLKLRDMDMGYFLKNELEAIDELIRIKIDNFSQEYFI